MTENSSVYIVDTSSFIDMKIHYPIAAFPTFWINIGILIRDSRIQSPITVFEEISRKDDELTDWSRTNYDSLFIDHTVSVLEKVEEILGRFPNLIDPNKEYDQADPYVIAIAIDRRIQQPILPCDTIVVTEEKINPRRNSRKVPIPEVCRHYSIPCLDIVDLILREGWTY
jgi:hypothetical protein